MDKEAMISKMNKAGGAREPFLFVIDFEMQDCIFRPLLGLSDDIFFSLPGSSHLPYKMYEDRPFHFYRRPVDFGIYKKAFDKIMQGIRKGNSFLANLTFPSEIDTDLTLEEIFYRSVAPYKLYIPNKFVYFSPECFVKIECGIISSFPMKGTIDASIPGAKDIILNDPKETAEHYTIVDLIRNDLSQVATDVTVERFRYINKVANLLQVSSVVTGKLPDNYHSNIGDIIFSMLPAGSVSGAPKRSTLQLICEAESGCRNFYTGIFGIFDGYNLESGVAIRYVEKREGKFFFRSGGGITANSEVEKEYRELVDKIYVAFRDDTDSRREVDEPALPPAAHAEELL